MTFANPNPASGNCGSDIGTASLSSSCDTIAQQLTRFSLLLCTFAESRELKSEENSHHRISQATAVRCTNRHPSLNISPTSQCDSTRGKHNSRACLGSLLVGSRHTRPPLSPTYLAASKQDGDRRRAKAFGTPPTEDEAPPTPCCPNQRSSVFQFVTFTICELETTSWVQATSHSYSQWRHQWCWASAKQSEKRFTKAWGNTRAPKSNGEDRSRRRAKGAEENDGALCEDAIAHLEEIPQ